jgi:hypothetical protein
LDKRAEPITELICYLPMLRGNICLFARISLQVVQPLVSAIDIDEVFQAPIGHPQLVINPLSH